MNDDWDGGDWAEHFYGPSDYEIERQQESNYESYESSEVYEDEYIDGTRTQFRDKEKNTFDSFIDASAYAQKKAAEIEQTLRVRAIRYGWEVIEDRLTSADILSECEDYIKDDGYFTAIELIDALRNKDHELALQLLKKPINVNVMDGQNVSALMIAAYRGYADICEKLLNLGAVISTEISKREEASDPDHINLWQRALMSRDQPTIDVIDKAYAADNWNTTRKLALADPNKLQVDGPSHLFEAARLGMTTLCVEIVTSGVEINISNLTHNKGDVLTPLSNAFDGGHITTCFVLVALGADTSVLKLNDNFSNVFESRYTPDEKAHVAQLINCQIWQQSVRDQFSGGTM